MPLYYSIEFISVRQWLHLWRFRQKQHCVDWCRAVIERSTYTTILSRRSDDIVPARDKVSFVRSTTSSFEKKRLFPPPERAKLLVLRRLLFSIIMFSRIERCPQEEFCNKQRRIKFCVESESAELLSRVTLHILEGVCLLHSHQLTDIGMKLLLLVLSFHDNQNAIDLNSRTQAKTLQKMHRSRSVKFREATCCKTALRRSAEVQLRFF